MPIYIEHTRRIFDLASIAEGAAAKLATRRTAAAHASGDYKENNDIEGEGFIRGVSSVCHNTRSVLKCYIKNTDMSIYIEHIRRIFDLASIAEGAGAKLAARRTAAAHGDDMQSRNHGDAKYLMYGREMHVVHKMPHRHIEHMTG